MNHCLIKYFIVYTLHTLHALFFNLYLKKFFIWVEMKLFQKDLTGKTWTWELDNEMEPVGMIHIQKCSTLKWAISRLRKILRKFLDECEICILRNVNE